MSPESRPNFYVYLHTSCSSILLSILYTFVKPCCSSNLFVTTGIKSRLLENDIDDCDLSGNSPGNRLSRCLRLIAELLLAVGLLSTLRTFYKRNSKKIKAQRNDILAFGFD
uniref:Uncharacterized protein n=1 Tax=Glossina pallidipes TaxID=7398 RepID=A0A1A9Z5D2_GLOPL